MTLRFLLPATLSMLPLALVGACQSDETSGATTGETTLTTGPGVGGGGPGPTTGPGGSGAQGGGGGGNGGQGGAGMHTALLNEAFDNADGFTLTDAGGTVTTFHSDGSDIYFGISNGMGGGLWGGDTAPTDTKAYVGFTGSFVTGENLDADGDPAEVRLIWSGIDISGKTGLELAVLLAEFNDLGGHIDDDDIIRIEVQIDGGGFTRIIEFFAITANDVFREDQGLDGTANGLPLNQTASLWTKSISGTGTTLDVRLSIKLDGDDEDVGVDNLMITAD